MTSYPSTRLIPRTMAPFQPYQYRFLEALPNGEREEAMELAHSFNRCMGRYGRFSQTKMDRLVSLNAKGGLIYNTGGDGHDEFLRPTRL